MIISFCIICVERLPLTLEQNVKEIAEAEFVLLDHGSKKPIRPWVLQHFSKEMESGKLILVETEACQPARAMNIAHSWASGDVLCSLRTDEVITPHFFRSIKEEFSRKPNAASYGVSHKNLFRSIGGYDETLNYGWGWHEYDLLHRLLAKTSSYLKLPRKSIQADELNINFDRLKEVPNDQFLLSKLKEIIPSFDVSRINTFSPRILSGLIHKIMSDYNVKKGNLVANKDKCWGEATVVINAHNLVNSWMHGSEFFNL